MTNPSIVPAITSSGIVPSPIIAARLPANLMALPRDTEPARITAAASDSPAPAQMVKAVSSMTAWGRISDQ